MRDNLTEELCSIIRELESGVTNHRKQLRETWVKMVGKYTRIRAPPRPAELQVPFAVWAWNNISKDLLLACLNTEMPDILQIASDAKGVTIIKLAELLSLLPPSSIHDNDPENSPRSDGK